MDSKALTQKQRKQITQAANRYFLLGLLMTLKYCGIMVFLSVIVAGLNTFYVQSPSFPFFATMVNFIFIAHFMMKASMERGKLFREQIKRIVDQEEK